MSKIRLLILLLISFIFFGCSSNSQLSNKTAFSVAYIAGEYDGLVLSNKLSTYLNNFDLLDKNSKFEIQANVSHSTNLFITNVDNTSDREKVSSTINFKIFNKEKKCYTYSNTKNVSQFYVLASSDKFISNKSALEEIKINNTEYLVKKFINDLNNNNLICEKNK